MGVPMIQVFMIAARQISKPVADAVLRYGKNHPLFRNKILIPIGRGLVRLTTRLRMKRLGLGEPVSIPAVSEAAALEQASDFVQQLVLFSYSLGVFYGYYMYTKLTTPETVKLHEFEEFREESEKIVTELRTRVEHLEATLRKSGVKIPVYTPPPPSKKEGDPEQTSQKEEKKDEGAEKPKARFPRISSLPVDSASNVVLRVRNVELAKVRSLPTRGSLAVAS
ncbi:hypothetical protein Q1695_002457 [Nippostrongylus brasiliensis]|nr:hypothetical protein Q1695_002457 [Nippostrongylus brasiliensis]